MSAVNLLFFLNPLRDLNTNDTCMSSSRYRDITISHEPKWTIKIKEVYTFVYERPLTFYFFFLMYYSIARYPGF